MKVILMGFCSDVVVVDEKGEGREIRGGGREGIGYFGIGR